MIDKTISIAIVTRNRSNSLRRCLSSLTKQPFSPLEVLVIDNASKDKTKKVALSFGKILPVRYIVELQVGIPYARNRALKEAKGDILAFIDDDCEATPAWSKEIVKAHRMYPEVVAIQGESTGKNLSNPFSLISHLSHQITISKNLIKNALIYIDTKNISFKLKDIRRHRLKFDTNFMQGSDVDFAKQLLSKKLKIIFYPKIKISFLSRDNLFSFPLQRFRWGKANAKLYYKWPREYFPNSESARKVPRLLKHPLLKEYWDIFIGVSILRILSRLAEKIGRLVGEREIQYANLGYAETKSKVHRRKNVLKTISIGIITKDRALQLKRLLLSLSVQSQKPHEVLIVDSSSGKQTARIVKKFEKFFPIVFIRQGNFGRGVARNAILSQASKDIIAFIDDDEEAANIWVEETIYSHNYFRNDVAIQGRIISRPEQSLWALVEQFRMDRWFIERIDKQNYMQILTTKNASVKRELIIKIGIKFTTHPNPKDANLIAEEVDFAHLLLLNKQKIRYAPSIVVKHWERASLLEFLKQQYRKGYSYRLNKKEWPKYYESTHRRNFLWILKTRLFLPVIEMLFHPILRKYISKFVFIIPVYYLSVLAYLKGSLDALSKEKESRYQYIPRNIKIRPVLKDMTVAIITRDRQDYLSRALYSIARQELQPAEILIIDNGSKDATRNIVTFFEKHLKVRYIFEPKVGVSYARNRALLEVKTQILAFIDDDCEMPRDWLANVHFAHKKYEDAVAIQGLAESIPRGSIFSILALFNRQTWIRDNMIGDRNLYWDMVRGKVKKGIPVLFCDTRNVSYKVSILRRFKVAFDENFTKGSDYDFAKQLLHHKQTIMFYPLAKVYHYERATLRAFLQQRFYQGRSSQYLFLKWPRKYFPIMKRGPLRKFAAFVYFSLANNYPIKLPALITLFWLSEVAYLVGKNYQIKHIKQ